jgi:hypothetical protein
VIVPTANNAITVDASGNLTFPPVGVLEFTTVAAPSGWTGSGTSASPYQSTVPTGAKFALLQGVGGGGGGGGGYRRAAGVACCGGGGGAGGNQSQALISVASLIGQTIQVTIGAGGAGGAGGATTDGTAGSAGTAGGQTSVKIGPYFYLTADGGGGGGGGTTSTGTSGVAGSGGLLLGTQGGASNSITFSTFPQRSTINSGACVGGGAGGGLSAANVAMAGMSGIEPIGASNVIGQRTNALSYPLSDAGVQAGRGSAGTAGGGNGGAATGVMASAGGGGANAAGAGGTGGNGAYLGGGAGGGGAGTSANGGAGGYAGDGFCRVTYLY